MGSSAHGIRSQLLVLRYRRGDDQALVELVSLWERPLFYFIRRIVETEEDAWDVLQEVWFNVFRKIGSLRDPGALTSWLYRVARHAAFRHLRKNPGYNPLPEDEDTLEGISSDALESYSANDAEAIHWGLGQLELAHREVLTLHFLEGFTLAEIAAIIGVPVGTVKSRLHYAKKALAEKLRKEQLRHE